MDQAKNQHKFVHMNFSNNQKRTFIYCVHMKEKVDLGIQQNTFYQQQLCWTDNGETFDLDVLT